MKEDPKIDELLNSFIDGELTAREQTEIQRLITHDAKIAQRVRQLQKCKMLVSFLPVAEAPDEILEDIKASLERRTLLGEQPSDFDERAGARHLLVRKVLAAAAMIGLVTVLAAVVHTIVAPETVPEGPVAIERRNLPGEIEVVEPRPSMVAMEFGGRLELKTSALVAVDAFINKAIEDNGLSGSISPAREQDKSVYSLSCSREDLNLLLADLGSIWEKFNSATLFVETEVFGRQVVVDAVTAEQIAEIVNQDSLQRRTDVARDLALLNNTAERLPGREIIAGIDEGSRSLITIPKPGLTWRQKTAKKPVGRAEDEQKVHLAIVVVAGSE
ncbi:MAG: anti-sigma factor family protein [Planctomycetota bacterium]|jgi:hypothetical protein